MKIARINMLESINSGVVFTPGCLGYLRYNILMAWAIITIYTSKCAEMDPQQLLNRSIFYSRCKKCDIENTVGDGYHPLLSLKVKRQHTCKSTSKQNNRCIYMYMHRS